MREAVVEVLAEAIGLCFTLAVVYFFFISDINARLASLEAQNAASSQETQATP